jgi:hypothetical protein
MDKIVLLTIEDLLSISKAREFGYGNAIFKIEDRGLCKIFSSYIKENALFTEELRDIGKEEKIRKICVDSVRPIYNEWAKIKYAVDIDSTLYCCIEAERITYQAYKSTLNNKLPSRLENLLKDKVDALYRNIPVLTLYRELYNIEIENKTNQKESA